ncbi:efflux transporter outer membrane subunit [Porphyrobacter algicida]|uniref:Efflux transporter outer membrane subunit n=1 Tax=Qipengyuania algicida TaxID=1836209 RepID=A0A845AQC3_9SPHN|nr:efflux transporter outer membrane subunit [Qipengyuania algicida]MXP29128.1 efflux transporter outer membrane subunit [Qipengyuania algicida]
MRDILPIRTLLFAASAASALAGCTVGPDFAPPQAPSATSYRAAYDTSGMPVPGAPAVIRGEGPELRWWTAFNSPALDKLVDQALAKNASLEASNATLAAAREQVAAVRGKQLPQIDANARAEHEQVNLASVGFKANPALGIDGNPEFNLYSVGAGVSFDLDPFGKLRRGTEETAAKAEAQLRQTEAAHLAVAGKVVTQVLTIAAIRDRIATANALLADDRRNVDLTNKRKQAGEGTLVEVLNAQSQFENDRSDIPQLKQQLAEARHLLATLIGVTPSELGPTDFDFSQFTLPSQIPVTLPSQLVHKRPDILQAEANFHAATAAVGVATANLYPDINIGASLEQGSTDFTHLLGNSSRGFDLFGGLLAPIFHGGTLKAEKRAAVDRAKASAATYRQTVLQAFQQVADLLQAVDSDARSVANQHEATAVAQKSLNLSRRSFQVGNTGILQTLDAERQYQKARYNLVEAQARQFTNVAQLYVATAGGWIEQKN